MPFSFEGLKFYVSINAPNRTKKAIRDNGGIIIANEAAADMRITDPSRQVPSRAHGAYHSYQWVLDCVRQQRQVDETPYVITRPAAPPPPPPPPSRRPAARTADPTSRSDGLVYAPANSQRRHRNAFTYEDDRILRNWVIKEAEYAIKHNEKFLDRGNDMYKRLEEKYPHHTYHSWRNRWLTKLALITDVPVAKRQEPRPRAPRQREQPQQQSRQAQQEQSEEEIEDVPDVQQQPPPTQASPQQARRPAREAPQEQPQQAAQEETEHDENSGRADELFFMNFTDYIIISKAYSAWKKEKRESGVSPKPTESFFSKLHQQYPDISLKDFRRRYHRLRNLYTKPNATPADSPVKASAAAASEGPSANHQNPVRYGAPAEGQAAANEDEGDDNSADEMEVDGLDLDDDAILNGVGDHDSAQQEFQNCLNEYNDYLSVYVPPSFYIGGRFLDTYSLWTALQESADNSDRIDWDAVIETLGLDKDKHPQLASQLPAWYELNLKEFRSFWNRYKEAVQEAEEEESEEEEAGGEEEADEEAEGDAQEAPAGPSSGTARRSTGFLSSIRGIFGGGDGGSSGSTPAPESPSKHVRFSGAQPGDGAADEEKEGDDEEDDDFESRPVTRSASRQQQTPKKQQKQQQRQKKAAALEPETQDFAYDPETQAPLDLAGDDEIEDMEDEDEEEADSWQRHGDSSTKATPARQLRTEERIVAAVPQSLPPPGSAKRKRTAAVSAATPAKRQQRKSMA